MRDINDSRETNCTIEYSRMVLTLGVEHTGHSQIL